MASTRGFSRFARLFCTSVTRARRPWTPAEDARLKSLVENSKGLSWPEIAFRLNSDRHYRTIWERWNYSLSPDITRGRWKRQEVQELSELTAKHGEDSVAISKELSTKRTAKQVREKVLEGGKSGRRWTPHEDMILKWGVMEFGREFAHIAKYINGRTGKQCIQRWDEYLNPAIKKGPWDAREVEKLMVDAKELCQAGKWSQVGEIVVSRTGRQCEQKWLDLAMRARTPRPWTQEEDARLRSLVGNTEDLSWTGIASLFGGDRSANSIRQRYKESLSTRITRGPWEPKELEELHRLAQEHPGEWTVISNKLASKRTAGQVREKVLEGGKSGRRWTPHEDMLLKWGVMEFGREFAHIAKYIKGRTRKQCIDRWDASVHPALKKGPWDEREVEKLTADAREFCMKRNWARAAKIVATRSRKQCQQKWLRLRAKEMREKESWIHFRRARD